jgi:hypothetical protein
MLSSDLRYSLAHDIDFRLVLNRSAKCDKPLSDWIVSRVVSDASFEGLLRDTLDRIIRGMPPEDLYRVDKAIRADILTNLQQDERLTLLIAENIEKSNERIRVLMGLKTRLESLWRSDPASSHNGPKGESSTSLANITSLNPLFRWGIASALGMATVATAGNALVQWREFSREVDSVSREYSQVREEISRISEHSDRTTEKIETIQRDTERSKEILQGGQCPPVRNACEGNPQSLPNPWTIKLDGLPQPQKSITPEITNNNQSKSDQPSKTPVGFQVPNPWVIKLDGLPSLPTNLRLQPNYRIESLPGSTQTLNTKTDVPINVEYPKSYEEAVGCLFKIKLTKLADPAEVTFERQDPCPVEDRVTKEQNVRIRLNQKPIYVPEIDAFVSLTSHRQGFLHLGKLDNPQILIQAAAYSPRTPATKVTKTSENAGTEAAVRDSSE